MAAMAIPNSMHILAHRGLWDKHAPNSLGALKAALSGGFSLETDLRLSYDKRVVICHDENLKENFGLDIDVADLNYGEFIKEKKELESLLPSFDVFIDFCLSKTHREQVIALHIKDYANFELIERVCMKLDKLMAGERIFLFDILPIYLKSLKDKYPRRKTGISVGEQKYLPIIYTPAEAEPLLSLIDVVWADEWRGGLYKQELFVYYKNLGKEVYAVSPELHRKELHPLSDSPERSWDSLLVYEPDGICTDYPHKLLSFYEAHRSQTQYKY